MVDRLPAREIVARWLQDMDWSSTWEAQSDNNRDKYLAMADEYMSQPENLAIQAEAWEAGAEVGFSVGRYDLPPKPNPFGGHERKGFMS